MATFVAFLRAVNVAPRRRVPMATARTVLERLGYTDVASFANSGNLLFSATGRAADLEAEIRSAMEDEFGIELTTFVRTARQLRSFVADSPFGTIAPTHTHFGLFTLTPLTAAERRAVAGLSNERDEVIVVGRDVHWLIRAKSTETTLGPKRWLEALPDNPTTARNMNLVRRLIAKLPG